ALNAAGPRPSYEAMTNSARRMHRGMRLPSPTLWVSREQRRLAFASRARSARELDPLVRHFWAQRHHWLSQGTPSLFPSILVFGEFRMKYVASAQEVI